MKKSLITLVFAIFLMGGISLAGNYTSEQENAYNYAYSQKITTVSSIEKASMNSELTRIAMAKMISNFAINVLGLQPNTSIDCSFLDVSGSLDEQYNYGVTQACQLGLMGIGNDGNKTEKFDPNTVVTRAQFGTAFSRALSKAKGKVVENGNPYYSTHLEYLQSEGIIKSATNPSPSTVEKRGNVMIMMMRAGNNGEASVKNEVKGNPDYYYEKLNITANVGLDGIVDVKENFTAKFNAEKHGIIRAIPLSNINVSDVNVKGKTFTTYTEGGSINIKIGDANKFVSGIQNYPISYKIDGLINKKNSELYRNLVGYDFDTNINTVTAEIILPKVYTGFTSEDFLITTDGSTKTVSQFKGTLNWGKGDKITITYDKGLSAKEGITLAIKFPKGYFDDDQFQKISAENLAKLKDKGVIRGPKDAKITIVEFTELLCPYCQRQSQQGTITSAIQQFSGQVNSISRSFIIHGDAALQLSLAMECVADLKPGVYYDVLDGAFGAYPVDMTGIVNIAVENGVNKQSLQSCVEDGKYIQSVIDLMDLGAELGVNGTPGSLVINNESLKYELIAGAYSIETFVETIESLLN